MNPETLTLIQIAASAIFGALGGLLVVGFWAGTYKEKVDQLEKANLDQRLSKLEGGFEERKSIDAFIRSSSPVTLTQKGTQLLDDSGGRGFVDRNKDALINAIRDGNPKSAYDVQELAKQVIRGKIGADDFTPLKDYTFKEGLELEVLITVLSLYLRDLALPALGFNLDDIDGGGEK